MFQHLKGTDHVKLSTLANQSGGLSLGHVQTARTAKRYSFRRIFKPLGLPASRHGLLQKITLAATEIEQTAISARGLEC